MPNPGFSVFIDCCCHFLVGLEWWRGR